MIRYSYFEPADLFPVLRVVNTLFQYNYHPSIFLACYENWKEGFIVAKFSSKLVGFIMGKKLDRQARILLLGVLPQYQGRGIGTTLLSHFEKEVANLNISRIFLEVRISNVKAIRFYQLHGFTKSGYISAFYKDGCDALVMTKDLNS